MTEIESNFSFSPDFFLFHERKDNFLLFKMEKKERKSSNSEKIIQAIFPPTVIKTQSQERKHFGLDSENG